MGFKEGVITIFRFWKSFIVVLVPLACLPVLFQGNNYEEHQVTVVATYNSLVLTNESNTPDFPMCLCHAHHGVILGHRGTSPGYHVFDPGRLTTSNGYVCHQCALCAA